ncbi:MAG: hypothetical protein ACJ77A_14120 [Actinomycetota bacterium]
MYYELGDGLPALLWRAGISVESFLWRGKDWISDFLNDLPTIATQAALRYKRHKNPSNTWKLNDFRDSDALREAVPYCRIVVTERHARAMLREACLDRRFGTLLLGDLRQLPMALEDRSDVRRGPGAHDHARVTSLGHRVHHGHRASEHAPAPRS